MLEDALKLGAHVALSSLNAGEVFYRLIRNGRAGDAESFWSRSMEGEFPFQLYQVTDARVKRAAALKGQFLISYADGFAIALARELRRPLVTGDPEIRAVAEDAGIELDWVGD